jgi:filamentous hemagglutinin family protein
MKYLFLFTPVLFVLLTTPLWSLPEGTEAVRGGGSFSTAGKEMTITAPDGSVFRHDRFDLSADESVRFVQPSEQARVLNRIAGASPSQINGRIEANGQVYLVNPAGVVFGEGSSVEAARLHVVAGELSDEDFDAGRNRFSNLSGSVVNRGEIRAGSASLSAGTVTNQGQIYAPEGYIALSAGETVELSELDGSLAVSLQKGDGNPSVSNSSIMSDLGGQALLGTGILQASKVSLSAGEISADGQIRADRVVVNPHSRVGQNSDTSSLQTSTLEIVSPSSALEVNLDSPANRISRLQARGTYQRLGVSSASTLSVGAAPDSAEESSTSLYARHLDLRSYEGDLLVNEVISPPEGATDSTLLLAARKKVSLRHPSSNYPYLRRVAYGQILEETPEISYPDDSSSLDPVSAESAFQVLAANEVKMYDLSASLPPELVLALAQENPAFAELQSSNDLELEGLSDAQLKVLLDYGYLSGYSYFLKINPPRLIPLSGAEVFGGDFSAVAHDESTEENSGGEDSGESETPDPAGTVGRVASAIPFAPLTTPVLSPAASRLLDDALNDQSEATLQRYLYK